MRLEATFGPGRVRSLTPVLQRRFDRPRLTIVRLMEGRSDLPEGGARVRLIPESAAEFGSNIPWIMEKRLEIIEEIALGSQTSGRDAPDMDEAWERMWEAVGRRDQEAEDEAFVDHTRAEVWEWWQGFSERPLLTDLYWRAGRREAKSGSLDSNTGPKAEVTWVTGRKLPLIVPSEALPK